MSATEPVSEKFALAGLDYDCPRCKGRHVVMCCHASRHNKCDRCVAEQHAAHYGRRQRNPGLPRGVATVSNPVSLPANSATPRLDAVKRWRLYAWGDCPVCGALTDEPCYNTRRRGRVPLMDMGVHRERPAYDVTDG